MLHDTMMALVVVVVIIGLACVWYFTADGVEAGHPRPLVRDKADPGTTSFVPRPDWFFYFLFYLLRIFKWPDSVVLGTVGIPTILLDPADRAAVLRPAPRAPPRRRPVALVAAVLVVISMGDADLEGRDREGGARLRADRGGVADEWAEKQGFADNPDAVAGAQALRAVRLPELPHVPR